MPVFLKKKLSNYWIFHSGRMNSKMESYDSKFFRAVLDAGGIGVWDWKPYAKKMYVSPHFYKMLEYQEHELKISSCQGEKLLHPDDKRWIAKEIRNYLINPDKIHIECRFITKFEKCRWLLVRGEAVEKDFSLKTLHVAGTYIDITEQKKAEQSLRKELQFNGAISKLARALISPSHNINEIASLVIKYAKEITKSSYGSISMIDSKTIDGNLFAFSNKVKNHADQAHPKGSILINEEDKDGPIDLKGYSFKKIKPFYTNSPLEHGEYIGVSDDCPKNVNFLSVPVMINKKPVGQIFLADADRDFTNRELKLIEQISEMYALALHHQQFDAEKLELQTQLRHAQKMQAIGTLAGGIAHDFNNILLPIIGYTKLAMDSLGKESEEEKFLQGVLRSADRARDLVSQILHFSHKNNIKQNPIKLQPVIKDTLRLMRATLPATIEMRQFINNDCSKVMADSSQIHQIIMNICTNAWHAMEKNGGIMEVSLEEILISADDIQIHNELKPGRHLKFTVTDTGCGIENSILEQIFDPYFTTKELNKGTGLGLSIAHGIVQNYGGDIEVLSKPGKGTAFHVYLPCCSDDMEQIDTRQFGIRNSEKPAPEILHNKAGI